MRQINRIIFISFLSATVILFNSCQDLSRSSKGEKMGVKEGLELASFEDDLFSIAPNNIQAGLDSLQAKYPDFYGPYFSNVMGFGQIARPDFPSLVAGYIQNADFRELLHDSDSVYNEEARELLRAKLNGLREQFIDLFPRDTFPRVITFISGFNNAIVNTENTIGIGIDLFMGKDYRFYSTLDLPNFLTNRYTPDHVIPLFCKGLFIHKYEVQKQRESLLDRMIYEGKQLYWMDQLIPEIADSLKVGYTGAQLEWCQANERNIYQLLVSENLYNEDYLQYRKYVDETPFTANLGNESAPRIGVYCGWQIVKAYAENSKLDLDQIMQEMDSQKILKISKYKP